jgi:DNA-directed RNA polymerase specialized sigma24 family protein
MVTLPAAEAVESLIREYGKLVFHTIYAMTGDWELSQDLTQETFLSALRAIDAAREASGPQFHARTWLMRIALNVVRMQRRRNVLIRLVPFSQVWREDDEGPTPGADGMQEQAFSVQPAGYGARMPVDPADVIPEREAVGRALASVPETRASRCSSPSSEGSPSPKSRRSSSCGRMRFGSVDASELRTKESRKSVGQLLARHPLYVRPPASWPSRRRVVDGTDQVVAPEKPVASSWSGPGRTGALHRKRGRSGRLRRRFRTHA